MKKNKLLYIEVDKITPIIITEYCAKTGLDSGELGYLQGFIIGNATNIPITQNNLINLLQHYFLAGIYYGTEHKDKIVYNYLNAEEIADKRKILNAKIQKMKLNLEPKKEEYVG